MKENYLAWQVKIDDFFDLKTEEDKLKFLLNFAVLAPSSHNSQPWRFNAIERGIEISVEPSRRLRASDKDDRQLFISLGSAITNIVVAADYYGYHSKIQYLPDPSNENSAAVISFDKSAPKVEDKNHLIFSISKRVTNRNKYGERMPPAELLAEIISFAGAEIQISIISKPEQKRAMADIALDAAVKAMADDKFREELSQYVKPNTTKSKIGMPAFGMGIATLPSLIAPRLIRKFNMNKLNRKKDEQLLKVHTPLFIVISTKEDSKRNWLKAGEIYENIALLAVQNNISTAIWAAPIQIGEFYKDFQRILNTDFRPQVFARMGYSKKITPHSPRIGAEEVAKTANQLSTVSPRKGVGSLLETQLK